MNIFNNIITDQHPKYFSHNHKFLLICFLRSFNNFFHFLIIFSLNFLSYFGVYSVEQTEFQSRRQYFVKIPHNNCDLFILQTRKEFLMNICGIFYYYILLFFCFNLNIKSININLLCK